MWSALYPISNHSHIRQLQFATHAFSQQVLQQAVQISICQWCYLTKIRPLLEYGAPVWGGLPAYLAAELEKIQSRSLDIIGLPRYTDHTLIAKPTEHQYNLRTTNFCRSVISGTQRHKQSFIPRATALINS